MDFMKVCVSHTVMINCTWIWLTYCRTMGMLETSFWTWYSPSPLCCPTWHVLAIMKMPSKYRRLLSEYRRLLSEYHRLLSEYHRLLSEYRRLLSKYRKLQTVTSVEW